MAHSRPQVSLVQIVNYPERSVRIEIGPHTDFLLTQTAAEDLQIQLGSVLNTLKGVQKKLPLRDRLRALRG